MFFTDGLTSIRNSKKYISIFVLRFGIATAYTTRAYFGRGQGDIFLDDVQCTGREVDLLSCGHRPIGLHNCGHSEDAGVICSPGSKLNQRVKLASLPIVLKI